MEFIFGCSTDISLFRVREIPYLQANMYYFVYHINATAPYQIEKSILSMNQ